MDYHHTPASPSHMGKSERTISVLAGALLLFYAAGRKKMLLETLGGGYLLYRGLAGKCLLSDVVENFIRKSMNVNIRTSVRVQKPVSEVYEFWRKLDNLPLFMRHLESVEVISPTTSQWKAKLPGIGMVSWNAVIVNEKKDEVLGWSSVESSEIQNAGKVEFRSLGDNETEIDVTISYRAPMGTLGENLARMFSPKLEKILRADIANFSQFIETGFIENETTDFRNELI